MSKITKIVPLATSKFLSLYDAEYLNKKDQKKHWIIASRKEEKDLNNKIFKGEKERIDAVIIVPIHKETKKLVLIKQFRVPVGDYLYELPAGLIDGDESIYEAGERELKEETGFNIEYIDKSKGCKLPMYISGGMTDESMGIVYCMCSGDISKEFLEDDEDIEVILVSREKAKEILNSNIKMDIKVYLILQSFVKLGEKIIDIE